MNAVLPDDLSHYARPARPGAAPVAESAPEGSNNAIEWDSHPGLEMEPGSEMNWVGFEPLQ